MYFNSEKRTASGIFLAIKIQPWWLIMALALILIFTFQNITYADGPGDLDPSFDLDGKVTTDFGEREQGEAVAIQGDGKILVAGSITTSDSWDLLVVRYNIDGSLDTSFGNNGKVTTDFGGYEASSAIIVQPDDGKIVVLGYLWEDNTDFVLARYNSNGSLDTTFDSDGKVQTDFGNDDFAMGIALQTDGKIIAVGDSGEGTTGTFFAVARYNRDGSLDSTFDIDGRVLTDFGGSEEGGSAVVIQADDKIVVSGYSNASGSSYDFAVARYNSDGSLDPTFDGDGRVITNLRVFNSWLSTDIGRDMLLQPDGKIVVVGSANIDHAWGLVRYNTDGNLDPSFDGDGKVVSNISSQFEETPWSAALQADGKIIVVGSSWDGSNGNFLLGRYNSNGSLDLSFSEDGWTTTDFGYIDQVNDVVVQPDKKILAVGDTRDGSSSDLSLARYLSDSIPQPALSLDKTAQLSRESIKPGDPLTYTIVVANTGEGDANGVVVTDTLPAHIIGSNLNEVVNIPAGQNLTFTFQVTLANQISSGETITNTAYFSHPSGTGQDSAVFRIENLNPDPDGNDIYLPIIMKSN